jgi:hypothetical protein
MGCTVIKFLARCNTPRQQHYISIQEVPEWEKTSSTIDPDDMRSKVVTELNGREKQSIQ